MTITKWSANKTTTNATEAQIGSDIPIPTDSVLVLDVEAHAVKRDGSKSKVLNARRVFHNDSGTITSADQVIMVPSSEPMGALTASVALSASGTNAQVKVTGASATTIDWEVFVQGVSSSIEFDATSVANLRSWHRASLGVTNSSGKCSAWADQSGANDTNRNFSQSTSGNRPTITASNDYFAGRPTLDFDGTDDWMASGTWSSSYSQPVTIYAVVRASDLAYRYLFDATGTNPRVALFDNTTGFELYAGASASGGTWEKDKTYILAMVVDNTNSAIYANQYSTAAATGTASTNALASMTLGARYSQDNCFKGSIAELITYSGAHNSTTRQTVMQALGAMYGVTVTS